MRDVGHDLLSDTYLRETAERILKATQLRLDQFSLLSGKTPSRLGGALYAEATVHLLAVLTVTQEIINQLRMQLALAQGRERTELDSKIDQFASAQVRDSLDSFLYLLKIDRTREFVKVSLTIVKKLASLTGGEIAVTAFEVFDALKDSEDMVTLLSADQKHAARVLLEFDLFTMNVLTACRYVVVCTLAYIGVMDELDVSASIEDGARLLSSRAKEIISGECRAQRASLAENGARLYVRFPDDGLWADSEPFN